MTYEEWLAGLKAGDEVAVLIPLFVGNNALLRAVTSVTPTQVIVGGMRFYKKNGRLMGDSRAYHGHTRIVSPQDSRAVEALEQDKRCTLRIKIRDFTQSKHFENLPIFALAEIISVMEKHKQEVEG